MRLDDLLSTAGVTQPLSLGLRNTIVVRVCEDSREVEPGVVFVARAGTRIDGARFVAEALERGAALVLAAKDSQWSDRDDRVVAVDDPGALLGPLCHAIHGHPSRQLKVVAVTGTNGKSSVVSFLGQLLTALGQRTATLGTLGYSCGGRSHPARETTPPAPRIAELLAEAVQNGCRVAALEASSHALAQGRLGGLEVQVGIVTNITRDHLDFHGDLQSYAAAKALLADLIVPGGTLVLPAERHSNLDPIRRRALDRGLQIREYALAADGHSLPGLHNQANVGATLSALEALGILRTELTMALSELRPAPGRLERVLPRSGARDGPAVYVDYAHNPDGLARTLVAARALTGGKLIVLFGCGGDRDRGKRPEMGRIAGELSDLVVLSSDNPRSEDPAVILAEIQAGIPAGVATVIEPDRRQAITQAILSAKPDDLVLLAGKGHERTQEVAGHHYPHDDREAAQAVLDKLQAS